MRDIRRVESTVDDEGYVIPGYTAWDCEKCGDEVYRYRGDGDVSCGCGAEYNAFGQRLRDDWRGNPAWKYDDVTDLDGFEMQYAGDA
jgi:hypothetical protein